MSAMSLIYQDMCRVGIEGNEYKDWEPVDLWFLVRIGSSIDFTPGVLVLVFQWITYPVYLLWK